MATHHTVKQGEHLSRIAKHYGFSDYRTIWDHPDNAELKRKRGNPNVIFPDDRLFIPDRHDKEEPRPTDQRHRFRLARKPLKLRLVLEDFTERPVANATCELHVENQTDRLVTDGRGRMERDITPDAEGGALVVKDPRGLFGALSIEIRVGHLDPVDEVSGQKARLNNLGYLAGPFDGRSDRENDMMFLSAIEEFQCDHGLLVDGKCGPGTQARLKRLHGS